MSHSILSLFSDRFDTRLFFGGCLININGETFECEVTSDHTNKVNPTYRVTDVSGKELCTFRPYHLNGGPFMYEIEGVSQSGGSASLIVPDHGFVSDKEIEDDDD